MLNKKISIKFFVTAIISAVAIAISFIGLAEARVNNNDQVVVLSQAQDNVSVKMVLPALTAATSTVLVDLSNTTDFKHGRTSGDVEVSQIRVDFSTNVVATTTVKLGVVASTTSSGNLSDIYWFDEVSFSSTDLIGGNFAGRQSKVLDYGNSFKNLNISSGTPGNFLSNDSLLATSNYATTTALTSPKGSYSSVPGVGDLVMSVYDQKGTATTSVSVIYRVK